jgi:hypothetical protein
MHHAADGTNASAAAEGKFWVTRPVVDGAAGKDDPLIMTMRAFPGLNIQHWLLLIRTGSRGFICCYILNGDHHNPCDELSPLQYRLCNEG